MFDRLIDLCLSFLYLFQFWTVVQPYQRGVGILLGRWVRLIEPGIHWMAPFGLDKVIIDSVVMRQVEMAPQSLTTKDGVSVVITPEILIHTSDIVTYMMEMEEGDRVTVNVVKQKISDYVRSKTWDEIQDNEKVGDEITTACRYFLTRRGVMVDAVILSDFVKSRSYRLWESQSAVISY